MIILRIMGGLGNQMFQYAMGRALSLAFNEPLLLDISGFKQYMLHQGFELQRIFACPIEFATEKEIASVLGWQRFPWVRRILGYLNMKTIIKGGFVVEPHFHYWSGIKNIPHNCYLAGYWQSEKYFIDVISVIRSDFTFKLPLSQSNIKILEAINLVEAISLHVRRNDYISNKKTLATHGVCSLDYYHRAIEYMANRVGSPVFYVFSDDMAWAKSNLKIDFPCHFIENNQGRDSYVDMRLMSYCKHHIIANSSFSWWGSWLNMGRGKIVIYPQKWFINDNLIEDLCPQYWVDL